MKVRLIPILLAFLLTTCALLPSALSLPQHGDEAQYGWSAAYFGGRLARLDFSAGSANYLDPGWAPPTYWTYTQPMASRFVYSIALAVTGAPTPSLPYSYDIETLRRPENFLEARTLLILRVTAILCAACGLALFCLRFGWRGFVAALLLLAFPPVRDDLARAWAEGPLMLGFGFCAVAYGSRWFAPACGLAAAFKLTALGLWPIVFIQGFFIRKYSHIAGLLATLITWMILTPPTWFSGGPAFLGTMLYDRYREYAVQSSANADVAGLFLPTRYLWPVGLVLALLICTAVVRFAPITPGLSHFFQPPVDVITESEI